MTSLWTPVDRATLLSTEHEQARHEAERAVQGLTLRLQEVEQTPRVKRATTAATNLTKLVGDFPQVVRTLVDCLAGQPQAASYEPGGGSEDPWCWDHERTIRACDRDRSMSTATRSACLVPKCRWSNP